MRRKREQCISNIEKNEGTGLNLFFDELFQYNIKKINEILLMNKNKPMFIANKNGTIEFVNDKWCNLCEYNKNEVINNKFSILHGPNTDKSVIKEFMDNLHEKNESRMNVINYTKTGKEIYLYVEAKRLSNELCYGFVEDKNSIQIVRNINDYLHYEM